MKKNLQKLFSVLLVLSMVLGVVACSGSNGKAEAKPAAAAELVNGDFEDVSAGQWTGWTRHDAAFNFRGVVNTEKIKGVTMEKSGDYYFAGTAGSNPPMRGTLTSDVFKLGGNGFITFKMGGGKNTDKV